MRTSTSGIGKYAGLKLLVGSFIGLGIATAAIGHESMTADGALHDNRNVLHDPGNADGHIPSNVNYGFELIGLDNLGGVETGRYTDVWASNGYAYTGTFGEPTCDRSGVYVSDISDPANPFTVAMIKSPPNTRINDVKTHEIGDGDYLFVTLEKCGPLVGNGVANGGGNGGHQQGQGGVSIYDISDPTKPHSVKQNLLDFQTHNTFAWTDGADTYLLVVDDENVNDLHVVDITKPQSPKLLATTGIGDWITTTTIGDDGQLFTGAFQAPLLHDIWVEQTASGAWQAVLSYWDAGFVVLDVSDAANPVFLGDSTYPAVDPVHGTSPAEGNAHAAVFGGNSSEFIFGGDEDFDAFQTGIVAGGEFYSASQGSDVPQIGPGTGLPSVSGPTTYVGLACNSIPAAANPGDIAVIQRGACAFTTKAGNAEAAGYSAALVFNHAAGCAASVSMLVQANIPALFVPRASGFGILGIAGYDPATCDGSGTDNGDALLVEGVAGQDVDITSVFDGWGYFHVLNNTQADVTVPVGKDTGNFATEGYLGHIGYYAPDEARNPSLASGFGDLTMHNLEADPANRDRSYISWYSAGMRAVEWRPGHLHNNLQGEGVVSWNVHEVGRWIAPDGSNFWGVHVTQINGEDYVLATDRNTGLHIFKWTCVGRQGSAGNNNLYCDPNR